MTSTPTLPMSLYYSALLSSTYRTVLRSSLILEYYPVIRPLNIHQAVIVIRRWIILTITAEMPVRSLNLDCEGGNLNERALVFEISKLGIRMAPLQ